MVLCNKTRISVIRSLACWLTLLVACCPNTARAIDEAESFGLLVETLKASDETSIREALLKGMLRGLEGRRNVKAPEGWNSLREELAASESVQVRQRVIELSQIFGDQEAIASAIAILKDSNIDVIRRRSTLALLLNQQSRQASDLLESLMEEPAFRIDAIRGYAIVENSRGPEVLLTHYPKLDDPEKRAVIETLAARKSYAEALLKALETGAVTREEISSQTARSLTDMLGNRFTKLFGDVAPVAQNRVGLLDRYKKMCNPKAIADADASRGRLVFQRTCAACHTLYGEGGEVGPDLTGSNRANLDYILLNSVDPSYDVPDAYKTVSVLTVDGRIVNGVLAEEDATRIILKTAEQPRVVIAKEDIEQRKISPKSMMPDGQLDHMENEEVLDLIKYLRTTEQVELTQ